MENIFILENICLGIFYPVHGNLVKHTNGVATFDLKDCRQLLPRWFDTVGWLSSPFRNTNCTRLRAISDEHFLLKANSGKDGEKTIKNDQQPVFYYLRKDNDVNKLYRYDILSSKSLPIQINTSQWKPLPGKINPANTELEVIHILDSFLSPSVEWLLVLVACRQPK